MALPGYGGPSQPDQPIEVTVDSGTIGGTVAVSNFPATQVVSGTVTATPTGTQTVAGTVGVSGSVAVTGTFFQATQPVSAAALPLPSGAATASAQTDGSQKVQVTVLPFASRSDTYAATGSGVTVDRTAAPLSVWSVAVKGTGAAAGAWDVRLEGSLDGTNFTQILQHTNVTGDGVTVFMGAGCAPSRYVRSRCAGLTLGGASDIVVTILGV